MVMSEHGMSGTARREHQGTREFPLGVWVRANAIGLGAAYGLLALFGDGVESLFGVGHESLARDAAMTAGLLIGAGVFVLLRSRALSSHLEGSVWTALAAGAGLAAGFVVGFVVAGPPFDFVLGVIALGTIGGALQWRVLRYRLARPGGLFLAGVGAWFAAGIGGLAVAVLAGDAIDAAAGGGLSGFVAVTTSIGLLAGIIGGAIEGRALRRRIGGVR
jgi:hypothetical protein